MIVHSKIKLTIKKVFKMPLLLLVLINKLHESQHIPVYYHYPVSVAVSTSNMRACCVCSEGDNASLRRHSVQSYIKRITNKESKSLLIISFLNIMLINSCSYSTIGLCYVKLI